MDSVLLMKEGDWAYQMILLSVFFNAVKKIEVGEDFARLHSSHFQNASTVFLEVPHFAIMKGEVAKTPGYVHTFHLEYLSLDRCKWLFMKFKEEKK